MYYKKLFSIQKSLGNILKLQKFLCMFKEKFFRHTICNIALFGGLGFKLILWLFEKF